MRIPRRFFIGADGEPRVWWHWANENRETIGNRERVKGWPSTGRFWLHWGRVSQCFTVEWVLGRLRHIGASVGLDGYDDGAVKMHVGVPLVCLFVSLDCGWTRWLHRRFGDREVKLSFHDAGVWWLLWVDDSERRYSRSFWDRVRAGCWHPLDTVLGKTAYQSTPLEVREVEVPMPERAYRGTAKLHEDTWTRPRWPWPVARVRRVTIEMADGEHVPQPGKGENSWDLDEDATFSLTTVAGSIEEAVGLFVASTLRSRRHRGGVGWRPEAARAG